MRANEAAEKERWTFLYKDNEIVLDRLPFIGFFMEIEGSSEEAINEVIQLLNISSCQVVRKNYGELMTEKFLELKLPQTAIKATFAEEAKFSNLGLQV